MKTDKTWIKDVKNAFTSLHEAINKIEDDPEQQEILYSLSWAVEHLETVLDRIEEK